MKSYKFKPTVFYKKNNEKSILLDIELDQLYHFTGDAALMVSMIAQETEKKASVTVDYLQENLLRASKTFAKNVAQKASIEEALAFMIKNNLIEAV
jgi:hypothetical protein